MGLTFEEACIALSDATIVLRNNLDKLKTVIYEEESVNPESRNNKKSKMYGQKRKNL